MEEGGGEEEKGTLSPFCFHLSPFPPKRLILRLTNYESETFSDSSLHRIFETENFSFPFFYEK